MSRTRVSRSLVAVVGVVIVLGAVAYIHNINKARAAAAEKAKELVAGAPAPAKAAPAVAPAKPVDTAGKPGAAVNHTGQISLPGAGRAMITQTPGAESPARAVTPTDVRPPADVRPPSDIKPPAAEVKIAVVSAKPIDATPAPTVSKTGGALVNGKALIDSGSLVAGRRMLNDALVNGELGETDALKAKELIAGANETLIFSPRRFTDDSYNGSYTMAGGDRLMKLASQCDVTWDFLKRINNISDERRIRAGQTLKTIKGPFHAVVSKSKFTMDVYLGSPGEKGSMYVRSYGVGLGKHGSTPTGTWMVAPQSKLKNPKWWGTADEPAREAGDPQNPLGKFWIGLHGTDGDAVGKEGFGIHGTIAPDTIGKEMSHGCIRLVNENVERVYEMLVDGKSTIIVKE